VTIDAPDEGDAFKEGKWVEFQATPTDPDSEDQAGLVVEWYEGDTRLGQGTTFSIRNLKPGDHIISVVVTDSSGESVEETVTIKVNKAEEEPGFGIVTVVMALLVLALLTARRRPIPK
jgi:PGF-CTERM protein